jgi:glycosyltransferase
MATYNSGLVTEAAIRSVLQQDYPHLDLVVIDGGSNQETLDILRKYSSWFGYWVSEPDHGVYNAMNKGLRAANGDVIFFLGSDDYLVDSKVLTDVADAFVQNPAADIVYGNLIWDWDNQFVQKRQPQVLTRRYLAHTMIMHQSIFVRKQLLGTIGGFSEHYKVISDYEWMLKVFLSNEHDYVYINRDISVMGTGGLSWTTTWEHERLAVMRQYFTTYEILRYRVVPLVKKAVMSFLHQMKGKIESMLRDDAEEQLI